MGSNWDFISKPNKCEGCPISEGIPLSAKIANLCHKYQLDWEVTYLLNDYGQQVCKLRRRIHGKA